MKLRLLADRFAEGRRTMAIPAQNVFAETMTEDMIRESDRRFQELLREFEKTNAPREKAGKTREPHKSD
jgi:hypothetical protein